MNLKTAILVFANSAQQELLHKPIRNGEKLFSKLTDRTIAVAKSSGIPFFLYTEKNQIGDTFGERFVNAIQATYDLGFENIIAIGNDTPHLKKAHLKESAKQLDDNKFVLGPSIDGGFYLMGLHKSQFNSDLFLKLPWQSEDILRDLSICIRTSGIEIKKLSVLYDIDTIEDLKTICCYGLYFSKTLLAIVDHIISTYVTIPTHIDNSLINLYCILTYYNKGSPLNFNSH